MRRKYQRLFGWLVGMALIHSAAAFTVWGPLESWQTADLDYSPQIAENGGSKILGAGSRVGLPAITYGFDETFAEFFGEQGIQAVDQAMAILNGLPKASAASPNLTEFVTDGNQQVNYTAEALGLIDLKSLTLNLMIEHLGLLGETHVYDLSLREAIPNTVCEFDYYVINRNYDPITYNPSTFVNGIQYGYNIVDGCPVLSVGAAIEYPKDTTASPLPPFTAVATIQGLLAGGYYLNLTRDDFGGLRWLYRRNHLLSESIDPNSTFTSAGSSAFGLSGFIGLTNAANPTFFGGVEKVTFVKIPYTGATFTPVTYNYSKLAIVNGQQTTVQFTRFITQPDIIFSAADLIVRAVPFADPAVARSASFLAPPIVSLGGLGNNGPGPLPNVILPLQSVTFNNANQIIWNESTAFLSDNSVVETNFTLGSFGSSSAPPIVFPNGASIIELENQILSSQTTGSATGGVSTTYNPFGFGFGLATGGTVTFLGSY